MARGQGDLWPAESVKGRHGRKLQGGSWGDPHKVCALGSEALPWHEYLCEAAAADAGCAEGGPRLPGASVLSPLAPGGPGRQRFEGRQHILAPATATPSWADPRLPSVHFPRLS